MNKPEFFEAKKTSKLFGLKKDFDFISSLYLNKKLPRVTMISGNKGSGKSTLINHFLFSIFDKNNYNREKNIFTESSLLYKQLQSDIFPNIIYINGSYFEKVKVEDIRNLKNKIYQSTILDKDRFIIFDDIELFNINSLNALLKTIEEPNKNNFFFLINNKTKKIVDTIKSRSLEIKIILNNRQRIKISNDLLSFFKLKPVISLEDSQLTPGNFIKFNYIFEEFDINLENGFIENLSLLLNLYKKYKDILFINIAFFLTNLYFKDLNDNDISKKERTYEIKNVIFNNLNNFLLYNINQNALINELNQIFKNE
tara:strand:- start:547 stop:1482 length:936 start_codon:yes stop_codon:yes gene_type:complete